MKFAYADPPYFGCCGLYNHYHPDGRCWDDLTTHVALLARLEAEYPDGWMMSLSSPALRHILLGIHPEHEDGYGQMWPSQEEWDEWTT